MMKGIIALATIIVLTLPEIASANDCGFWQSKLNSVNRKISNGGNQSQVKQWRKESNFYATSLERCNKSNGTHKWIEPVSGKSRKKASFPREQPRPINTDNPQSQQIIKTCNFWIQQYNQTPNENTQAMKNTACRNADNLSENASNAKPEEKFKPTRPLKECVKPENAVDNDVKLCMQGLKEPIWNIKP